MIKKIYSHVYEILPPKLKCENPIPRLLKHRLKNLGSNERD